MHKDQLPRKIFQNNISTSVRITTGFKVVLVLSYILLNKVIIVLTQANMHQTEK